MSMNLGELVRSGGSVDGYADELHRNGEMTFSLMFLVDGEKYPWQRALSAATADVVAGASRALKARSMGREYVVTVVVRVAEAMPPPKKRP